MILGNVGVDQESVETPARAFENCLRIQYEVKQPSLNTVAFKILKELPEPGTFLKVVESDIREELTDLLTYLKPKLGTADGVVGARSGSGKNRNPKRHRRID